MIWQLVHFDGLMQVRRNPGALAMELRLSCTNPSSCYDNFTVRIWISLVELLCWFLLIFKASKDSEFRNFYIVLLLTWTRCWTQIWDAMSSLGNRVTWFWRIWRIGPHRDHWKSCCKKNFLNISHVKKIWMALLFTDGIQGVLKESYLL